ncbi:MAG: MBOAT family O-acyltransferase [Bacteroidota bacterium]
MGIDFPILVAAAISCVALSTVLPSQKRWYSLLFFSILFFVLYAHLQAVIGFALIGITYLSAKRIARAKNSLGLSIALILLPLILNKALVEKGHFQRFTSENLLENPASFFGFLGISYVTFNLLSYLIDVKRKYIKPEENFLKFLLYALYFPALSSGPLHRYKYLNNQFEKIEITTEHFSKGGRLILWGLFKNLVLGDRILSVIQTAERNELGGFASLVIGLLFFLYIYLNFSSFIDFFRGVSYLLGVELKRNFGNRIYVATSRKEFWKGWHITLNNWFRDYYLFSVMPKRRDSIWTNLVLWSTFFLIALWHELSIQMVIWGSANGLWIVLEYRFLKKKFPRVVGLIYHLGISSLLALIFIKKNPSDLISDVFSLGSYNLADLLVEHKFNLSVIVVCFFFMDVVYRLAKNKPVETFMASLAWPKRWGIYVGLVLVILFFGTGDTISNYYIQF